MDRRTFLAAAVTAGASAIAGCTGDGGGGGDGGGDGGDGGPVQETSAVSMTGSQFVPRNVRVDPGTEVTWTNDDSFGHTVTSASDNWSKDVEVAGGETATHTFESSGVYDVYCRFHGSQDLTGMSMKVAVGDATIENPLGGGDGGDGGDDDGGGGYDY